MKIYTSPASVIEYEAGQDLLKASWLIDSIGLSEAEVQVEITNVLSFAREFRVKRIVVDTRLYPFRENHEIQFWINHHFMPLIIEIGVEKYAIIVNALVKQEVESLYDGDEDIQVEYFTQAEEALRWAVS